MWRELGVADIESYIDRVGVELREAMQEAATGECSAAHIAPDVIPDEERERGKGSERSPTATAASDEALPLLEKAPAPHSQAEASSGRAPLRRSTAGWSSPRSCRSPSSSATRHNYYQGGGGSA